MRELDTESYVGVLKSLVEEGHEVSLLISGSSMAPFLIHHRDTIWFRAPDRELKAGDMVFYLRLSGQYVMHRIRAVKNDGYYLIGDGQQVVEGPIAREQIFAVVCSAVRKGRTQKPGSFWWEFFEKIWIRLVPLRPILAGGYRRIKPIIRRIV